jgi:hypothetical protein
MNNEDIAVWPDGDFCFGEDLEDMMQSPCAKSDDYYVLTFDTPEWLAFCVANVI